MGKANDALGSKDYGNNTPHWTRLALLRLVSRSGILMLLSAGLVAGLSSQSQADPPPTANRVFTGCTFTTGANTTPGTLNSVLTFTNAPDRLLLDGDQIKASYIIIYVRQNPNDGQHLDAGPYTGPIICRNASDVISATSEGTVIPGNIDILGTEEASHLQYRPTPSGPPDPENNKMRVCHTVANITDCFTIQAPTP